MITSQDYSSQKELIPIFVPQAYYYQIRDVDLYPYPPRHPDTVAILCLWFKCQTRAGERSYQIAFSLNASGHRIVETFQSEIENRVDAWLEHIHPFLSGPLSINRESREYAYRS